ncbi:two-component system sensor histidine kinase DraK [Planotetraspora phitsanulokensis]|uniref:Signal transduction histidine-protein kinase/phosphatase MprB n=1 Tax=Planotetraspora phitsanulokensis TaxID=575192 RepID=A0A8J3UFC0_9ACTN|nr:ATP-binding protein [Planotetraspora phitsanulokensis]GII43436.1 two-component sensor histidine kinase [Planotetraspora phitsanulokensis]
MRRRLLSSMLLVAVIAVLLLGVPLAVVVVRLINDEAARELRAEANRLLIGVEYSVSQDQTIDPNRLGKNYPDRYIQVFVRGNPLLVVGTPPPAGREMTEEARSENGYVRIGRDSAQIEKDIHARLVLTIALAIIALGAAVGLASVTSRRLTLPLQELTKIAERLGSGDARPSRHRYGVPELDLVAEVLDRSALRISDLLSRERDFATDASHQLRTPLTGLTMRLEEIVGAAGEPAIVREEGEAAIVQVERLTAVIDELLAAARRQRHAQAGPIDVDDVVEQQITEWEPAFRRAQRSLVLAGDRGLSALGTTGGLSQVLSTLLENSLKHGDGSLTINTSSTGMSVVIEVADEGLGIPEDLGTKVFERSVSGGGGTGLGLTLARALVAADGGRLELVKPRPATFAIFLRHARDHGRHRVVSGPA